MYQTSQLADANIKKPDPNLDIQPELNQHLLAVARDQDKAAFAKLFAFFAPKIKAFGLKQFRQEALAMDLVQETMSLVWRKAQLYSPDKGKASTWIFTIMRNYSFDMLRKIKHNKEDNLSDDLWPLYEEADAEPDHEDDHLMRAQLIQGLDTLPAKQKEVVEAIYLKEMTHQELAEHLKVPLGTIKSRLRLGLEKLKEQMEQHND
ncbi:MULTISPECIES: sigma-70 family RNA polymerase sigma factor [unclassified Motilimonas]|uniref:sigma-70 family RNA polymerase sigma factor n=1 Tax=unclassified Motilimonas TaxID=2643697 RepID=UPI001E463ED7|nr:MULTISPECIES: sigma-70 family RNA polymerase sigma factor [unclassified Motilimonas]MCE0557751.1 sigma-70 family RNA polymerase sigma factor [Motilimonas sp. E26]MDO6525938.1 sigma-70 family RNA polymerase sigma factor [Motilimonas sp. 1_MG-2023]